MRSLIVFGSVNLNPFPLKWIIGRRFERDLLHDHSSAFVRLPSALTLSIILKININIFNQRLGCTRRGNYPYYSFRSFLLLRLFFCVWSRSDSRYYTHTHKHIIDQVRRPLGSPNRWFMSWRLVFLCILMRSRKNFILGEQICHPVQMWSMQIFVFFSKNGKRQWPQAWKTKWRKNAKFRQDLCANDHKHRLEILWRLMRREEMSTFWE